MKDLKNRFSSCSLNIKYVRNLNVKFNEEYNRFNNAYINFAEIFKITYTIRSIHRTYTILKCTVQYIKFIYEEITYCNAYFNTTYNIL